MNINIVIYAHIQMQCRDQATQTPADYHMIWSRPTNFQQWARLLALGADEYCNITEDFASQQLHDTRREVQLVGTCCIFQPCVSYDRFLGTDQQDDWFLFPPLLLLCPISEAVSFEGCIYWPITSHPVRQDSPNSKTRSNLQPLFSPNFKDCTRWIIRGPSCPKMHCRRCRSGHPMDAALELRHCVLLLASSSSCFCD